ncbi:S-layer family protein [Acidobacterium sp. S8]|uniref:beta strand repeat-containing protein n=1 Tax=Acidobacterium sp. S8 TaxID=1641854 RepID=UPI00131EB333|nr:choice-of-anchor D domain-containing protein [Acidobacterium sp. S8]
MPRVKRVDIHTAFSSIALLAFGIFLILTGCGYNVNGASEGSLVVTPDTVDFGDVQVGQTAQSTVTLLNQGVTTVSVSQVTVAGQTFFLNPQTQLPVTIAPGKTYSVQLDFKPGSASSYTGTVTAVDSSARRVAQWNMKGWGISSSSSQAQLTATPSSLAFGSLAVGASTTQTVTLTSTGTAPLTINSATASDGFAVSGASFPLTLKPKETATLQVQFKPTAEGAVSGSLAISSNDYKNSTTTIHLTGTGEEAPALASELAINPASLSFGNVTVGSSSTQPVTLSSSGTAPITIASAKLIGTEITLSGAKFPLVLKAHQTVTLKVNFAPTTAGAVAGHLIVDSDSVSHPTMTINIAGTGEQSAAPQLTTSAAALSFGDVTLGSQSTQPLTLTSTGTADVTVKSAGIKGTGFDVSGDNFPLTLKPHQTTTLQVHFKAATPGATQGTLAISSDSKTDPTAAVVLAATATPATTSQLAVSAASLDFGNVTVGDSSTQQLTLTSTGAAPVTISSASVAGTGFTVTGASFPLTIDPQQTATLQIQFDPTSPGAATGQLTIDSDSATNSAATVDLSGTAQAVVPPTPQLSANPASLNFNNVTVGSATVQPVTLSSSGTAPVTITGASLSGTGFTLYKAQFPITLQPGQTVALYVIFRPTDTDTVNSTLSVSSNAANPVAIPVSGTGAEAQTPQLTVTPNELDFSNVTVNSTATQSVTVVASGTSPVTVSAANINGNGFTVSGADLPVTLQPGQLVTFNVQFAPTAASGYTGSLSIQSDSATTSTSSVVLTGTGVASAPNANISQLTINPSSMTFGNVTAGSASTQPLTLSSTGTNPVVINSISVDGQAFSIADQTFPLTLNPNQSVTLQVQYAPGATGSDTGTVTINSNSATNATSVINLTGTAVAATSPQLSLSAASLSFGDITVGSSSTQPLTLTSTGTAPVVVHSAPVVGPGFSVSGATFPLTLNPQQAVTVQLTFDPTQTGSSSGAVTINSNSATNSLAAVTLTGTGTPAPSPQLSLSAASLSFGDVTTGSSSTQPLTLTSTGTATVTVNSVNITGSGFSVSGANFPLTLDPQQTVTLQVTFDPASAGGASGQLTIQSNSSTNTTAAVGLSGTGEATTIPTLSLSIGSLNFGDVAVGSSSTQGLVLTSIGTAPVTINSGNISGNGFSFSGASFPITLGPLQVLTLEVTFAPTAAGASTGTMSFASDSSTNATNSVALSGTGDATTPGLLASATSLSFGDVNVGSSGLASLTLMSSGSASVTINAVNVTGTGFSVSGASFPLTLSPGQTVTLDVVFSPTTAGAASGTLAINSNSTANAVPAVSLSGTGEAVQHEVDVSWNAPSSSPVPVVGYHVYRATGSSTTYSLLTSSVETATTYADNTVQSGTTYSYYVTSVDATGVESSPSNVTTASVP